MNYWQHHAQQRRSKMHKRLLIALTVWIAVLTLAMLAASRAAADDIDDLIYAIGTVESNHDDTAVGDQGRSIGRYQIMKPYWIDATEYDKTIGGKYEDVRKPVYAAKVMRAYWRRYARAAYEARDFEKLARCHNSGPAWRKKYHLTDGYWAKVQRELAK